MADVDSPPPRRPDMTEQAKRAREAWTIILVVGYLVLGVPLVGLIALLLRAR